MEPPVGPDQANTIDSALWLLRAAGASIPAPDDCLGRSGVQVSGKSYLRKNERLGPRPDLSGSASCRSRNAKIAYPRPVPPATLVLASTDMEGRGFCRNRSKVR